MTWVQAPHAAFHWIYRQFFQVQLPGCALYKANWSASCQLGFKTLHLFITFACMCPEKPHQEEQPINIHTVHTLSHIYLDNACVWAATCGKKSSKPLIDLSLCTFASVHFPGFWVFSFLITGSVGGICHSPVEGGKELCIPGSLSQKILKPLLEVFDVVTVPLMPVFLPERTSYQ